MKIFNVKVKLAVVAFCKFMKMKGYDLESTIKIIEDSWEKR
jgi:hypothetical protein